MKLYPKHQKEIEIHESWRNKANGSLTVPNYKDSIPTLLGVMDGCHLPL